MEKKKNLPIASVADCEAMRANLIAKGFITPSDSDVDAEQTRVLCERERARLVADGIISTDLYASPAPILPRPHAKDEGEYRALPITGERDYIRRRQAYFRMLQEILRSRRELGLVLGQRGANDPEWVF